MAFSRSAGRVFVVFAKGFGKGNRRIYQVFRVGEDGGRRGLALRTVGELVGFVSCDGNIWHRVEKIHGKKGSRPWSPFSRSMVTPRLGLDTSGKMPEPLGAFMCVGFASNLMSRLGGCFLGTLVDSTLVVLYFWLWFDDGGLFVVPCDRAQVGGAFTLATEFCFPFFVRFFVTHKFCVCALAPTREGQHGCVQFCRFFIAGEKGLGAR